MARVMVRSKGACPRRLTVRRTSVPGGPRNFLTARKMFLALIGSPSTWVIRSPDLSPARNAGVSSMGDTTLTIPFSMVTTIPSPPNSPLVVTWISRSSSALRYAEWGSSADIMESSAVSTNSPAGTAPGSAFRSRTPLMAASMSLASATSRT